MSDSEKAAREIYSELSSALNAATDGEAYLSVNVVVSDSSVCSDEGVVVNRIRQIIDKHMC